MLSPGIGRSLDLLDASGAEPLAHTRVLGEPAHRPVISGPSVTKLLYHLIQAFSTTDIGRELLIAVPIVGLVKVLGVAGVQWH
jgi:hypothetical protein